MMFNSEVFSILRKAWLAVELTLFKLVPVRPAVLNGVVLQYLQSFYVFLVTVICETMKCVTLVLFRELLKEVDILKKIVLVRLICFYF